MSNTPPVPLSSIAASGSILLGLEAETPEQGPFSLPAYSRQALLHFLTQSLSWAAPRGNT